MVERMLSIYFILVKYEKMRLKNYITFFVYFNMLILSSCINDDVNWEDKEDNDKIIKTSLQFEFPDLLNGLSETRSVELKESDWLYYPKEQPSDPLATKNSNSLRGVIYQFDSQGLLYHKTQPFDLSLNYDKVTSFDAGLKAGSNQSVYLFVADNDKYLPVLQSQNDWDKLSYEYKTLYYDDKLPFYAHQSNVDIAEAKDHTLGRFKLNRLCSKLIVDYEVLQESGFQVHELRLYNMPKRLHYKEEKQNSEVDYQELNISLSNQVGQVVLFIPENQKGQNSGIVSAEDKNKNNAPQSAMYIELKGFYKDKKVSFRIYPGSNATSDFNIKRNHWYRIGLKIREVYLEDPRVESLDDNEFVIHLVDGKEELWSKIKAVRLNKGVFITDLKLKNKASLYLNYTSNPGSFLNYIEFFDAQHTILFEGEVGYTFQGYDAVIFSRDMETQGDGSSKDPYDLYNLKQLKNIQTFYQVNYEGRNYRQMRDLDLSTLRYWEPLGDNIYPFRGVFDGNGYRIRNFRLNSNWDANYYYAGFWGFTDDCIIKKVHLHGRIETKADWMGGIVAYARNTRIEDSSVDVRIEQQRASVTGGVVGELDNGVISDCYNRHNGGYTAWNSTFYTGGIVGQLRNSSVKNVFSITAILMDMDGVNSGIGAVVGKKDEQSVVDAFYGVRWQNQYDTSIGIPRSQAGLFDLSYFKNQEFVNELNNQNRFDYTPGKWVYRSSDLPYLMNERSK